MSDLRPLIAVVGATGAQGSGVVRALRETGRFRVRALTRNPDSYRGPADEVGHADLDEPDTLPAAFRDAHGVFLVTNYWEAGDREVDQATRAVHVAKDADVAHFIWSTLPDVYTISEGRYEVPHFTAKSRVDSIVRNAGFDLHTYVVAPFCFENFQSVMAPQSLPDGTLGWALPLPADARVVHMGSIADLGGVVAGAFEHPETVGHGAYLAPSPGAMSFGDILAILNAQGRDLTYQQVPEAVFASMFPGAAEMAQMFGYWREHTYLGPHAEEEIALAHRVTTGQITDFTQWATTHLPATR